MTQVRVTIVNHEGEVLETFLVTDERPHGGALALSYDIRETIEMRHEVED